MSRSIKLRCFILFLFYSSITASTYSQVSLVKDINTKADSAFSGYPEFITALNGIVIYSADDASAGRELWKSDGTAAGTQLLKDINQTGDSNPSSPVSFIDGSPTSDATNFVVVGNKVVFVANDGTHGYELWASDGTANGTVLLKDIFQGSSGSMPTELTKVEELVFFAASNGVSGKELWRTDGTVAGTFIIKDIFPGESSASPSSLTNLGDKLVFTANDGVTGAEPWISDATSSGTVLLKDVYPDESGSSASDYVGVSDEFYFRVGTVIWKSNGTQAGTAAFYGNQESDIAFIPQAYFNEKLYFISVDFSIGVQSLYRSDGTEPGTVPVYTFPSSPDVTYYYGWTKVVEDGLFFSFSYEDRTLINADPDQPLIVGVTIQQLNEVNGFFDDFLINEGFIYNPGPEYAPPGTLDLIKDGSTYYTINSLGGGVSIIKKLEGSGTLDYEAIASFSIVATDALTVTNGRLFFRGHQGYSDLELWTSTGTFQSTHQVKNSFAPDSADPKNIVVFSNQLFFQAEDGSLLNTLNLWKSDGTEQGTVKLRPDIFLHARKMVEFSGALYFIRLNGSNTELWKTDGTDAGTVLTKAFQVEEIVRTTSVLFLSAYDPANGYELWKTDGTLAGTTLVKNINPGANSSFPSNFISFNGKLFFTADNGVNGNELWTSDGTAAGTTMLKDIYPGSNGSALVFSTLEHAGKLYFTANDGVKGAEIWVTDGTPAETKLFLDVILGAESSYPTLLASINGRIAYRALSSGQTVPKLWTTNGTSSTLISDKLVNDFTTGDNLKAYFSNDNDIWQTDGTAAATKLVDFIQLPYSNNVIGVIENKIFLSQDDGIHGVEFWRSNGTAEGTAMLSDIFPGTKSSFPGTLIKFQNSIFFTAQNGTVGRELWRYDPMPALKVFRDAEQLAANDEILFDAVEVGESSAEVTLTIKNDGDVPLVFPATPITREGAGAAHFKTGTFSTTELSVGASRDVDVWFEPLDDGLFTATLKIQGNDPVNSPFILTLKGEGTQVTAINPDEPEPVVHVYPNPSDGTIYIHSESQLTRVSLHDISGKRVDAQIENNTSLDATLSTQSLPGIYILRLEMHDKVVRKKVVILK